MVAIKEPQVRIEVAGVAPVDLLPEDLAYAPEAPAKLVGQACRSVAVLALELQMRAAQVAFSPDLVIELLKRLGGE